MDIFSRPPAIAEDTVQYALYPAHDYSDKASVTTFAACIHAFVDSLLPNFLWHRDAFELKVTQDPDDSKSWILAGTMRVGDCVDDEWCTVWLLREICAKWDLAISIFDSDGEFLLIEAADALPAWVKPTNSENRVWIYSSRLHLIPISHISPPSRKRRRRQLPGSKDSDDEADGIVDNDDDAFISVPDALKLIRDASVDTIADQEIENIVWKRISGYPDAANMHTHTTKAYLPQDIARALYANPSLVQKPVETFYTRDAAQLRMAHRMSRFPPQPSVLRTIKMTRTAYAQLVGQKFFPPKIFGTWSEMEGTAEWKWRDVGMKLASGFEMTYQESKTRSDGNPVSLETLKSSIEAKKEALRRNTDYTKYIENLVSAGYFKSEIQGSQLWIAHEDKAADVFLETRRQDDASRQSFASLVNAAITEAGDAEIPISSDQEDSDAWLTLNAENFDDMLQQTMGRKSPDAMQVDGEELVEDRLASEQASRLKNLADKVEEFVDGKGDLDGALFKDEEFSEEEEFSEDETEESSEEPDDMDRQAAMDALVPKLGPDEYGAMPASFHANSQRVAPTTIKTETVTEEPKAEFRTKPARQPIIERDRYDGVDSDDETDSGDEEFDEEEDERPQVVGDIEVDMAQEEQEFLEFSRQALGISDAQWNEIVHDRKGRGAFLPAGVEVSGLASDITDPLPEMPQAHRTPAPGPRPNVNPNLDSFEAVMAAMDEQLARARKPTAPRPDEGKRKATVEDMAQDGDDQEDIELAMDAELKAALENQDDESEEPMDYNLIKNFLESFKSQAGLAGPVGNLVGRLDPGWKLPRDEA